MIENNEGKELPFVEIEQISSSTLTIRAISLPESIDLFATLPDLISLYTSRGSSFPSLKFHRFTISSSPQPLLCHEITIIFPEISDETISHLRSEIWHLLSQKESLPKIIATKDLSFEKNAILLRKTILNQSVRHPKTTETLDELQRFLLSTEREFQKIRTPLHLLRIIRSLSWLRHRQTLHRISSPKRNLILRVFPATLQFSFGTREVLSITASLSSLSAHERCESRHLLRACQLLIPSVELVPQSFFTYRHPDDQTTSFYIEIEHQTRSSFSLKDLVLLRKELASCILSSIEKVDSHVDLLQNEEDSFRNSLLLNQQIKNINDPPQMIIQLKSQDEEGLDFYVTLIRVVKTDTPPQLPPPAELVQFRLLQTFVLGTIGSYLKQVVVLLVRCAKEPFFRHDHSIEFLKAREFVGHTIDDVFGKVRDLNGGLISRQYELLNAVKKQLSEEELKSIFLIEEFFYSLSPPSMKSLLDPQHVLTAYRFSLTLPEKLKERRDTPFVSYETETELYLGFDYLKACTFDEIHPAAQRFGLGEHELAFAKVLRNEHEYGVIVLLTRDTQSTSSFISWLKDHLHKVKKQTKTPQTIRISLSRPTLILDPRIGTDQTSGIVIKMLYEGLMRLDQSGTPSYGAAKRIMISDDGLQYTFFLRSSFWTNGLRVTAHDFEYAWKKILEPSFRTVYAYLFYPIKNALQVKLGKKPAKELGVYAISDDTLVVDLEKPAPYFLELCCLWIYSPLCREVDLLRPGWACYAGKNFVCNGPFKLISWRPKSEIQLARNDRYWDKKNVFLDHIHISIIENYQVAMRLFEEGTLDWFGEPLCDAPLHIFKKKSQKVYSNSVSGIHRFMLNVERPPFGSQKVRLAFSLALDRHRIISRCLCGDEESSYSILPQDISRLHTTDPLLYDLERARLLFEEGLSLQGIRKNELSSLSLMAQDREPQLSIAKEAARQWTEAFGIQIVVKVVEKESFIERLVESTHDIAGLVWISWFLDPIYTFDSLKDPKSPFNTSRWSNKEFTDLVERAGKEQQSETRNQLLRAAEELLLQEMPIIPVCECKDRYMKSNSLENVILAKTRSIDFKWATVIPPKSDET
jgi:oligopeptide transport system substrate-binding protein